MADNLPNAARPRVWQVGALCRAVADALETRFNPVSVVGEITGFSRAVSGHCYFSLKDASGQLRCAMFRRAAGLLDFAPADGEKVEVRGRLAVYEPRGELQLVVESMARAGQGSLFEQFLRLKAKLEAQGLFDPSRKRTLPSMPRGIGVVTSLGAAALHDVVTALQRRVPHIPVLIAPASVQGEQAASELAQALRSLYAFAGGLAHRPGAAFALDVILLVRGGGAMEDLWAFNEEQVALAIASSPVPVVSGIGHETDFTIADFVADLRAPTPTAAAELVSASTESYQVHLDRTESQLQRAVGHLLEREVQRLDHLASRLSRPMLSLERQTSLLTSLHQSLNYALQRNLQRQRSLLDNQSQSLPRVMQLHLKGRREACERMELRLRGLDPARVLQRGYVWLTQKDGRAITSVGQLEVGQIVGATLSDGTVDLTVDSKRQN